MNVDEFLTDLYNDELSDMFIGNRNHKVEPREKLLPLMNKAMLQAYAKFSIKFADTAVSVLADEKTYELVEDDVLAIVQVTNHEDRILRSYEVIILGNILYFPDPVVGNYAVKYKVKPLRFVETQDDEATTLELPDLLVPWMSSWVAARVFMARKDEQSVAKGMELMALASVFENTFAMTNTTNEFTRVDNSKLYARGFA